MLTNQTGMSANYGADAEFEAAVILFRANYNAVERLAIMYAAFERVSIDEFFSVDGYAAIHTAIRDVIRYERFEALPTFYR